MRDYTNRIDTLPIHTLCKIEICQKYFYSKIKWGLSIYNLSENWVKENIDCHLDRLYRKRLLLPISANITHLEIPQNKLGLNITSAKNFTRNVNYQFLESVKRHKTSKPGNCTKLQALNMLIQTRSKIKLLPWSPKNTRLKTAVTKSLTRKITRKYGTISCN